jgi:protein tyrosine phosphatase (PTP) superfamily phosphohydrolase (DUF442 family)
MRFLWPRVLLLLTLSGASVSFAVDASQSPTLPSLTLPSLTLPLRVSDSVTLAGALTADLTASANRDVLVIDLRMEEEGLEVEAQMLSAADIDYINIPVGRVAPDRETVDRFSKLIRDNNHQKIIVHCSSGNRAGLMWAAHLINQGTSVADAVAVVRPIATREPTRQAIVDYAEGQK